MHDVAWYCAINYVRSRDAQKQLARTSLSVKISANEISIYVVNNQWSIRGLADKWLTSCFDWQPEKRSSSQSSQKLHVWWLASTLSPSFLKARHTTEELTLRLHVTWPWSWLTRMIKFHKSLVVLGSNHCRWSCPFNFGVNPTAWGDYVIFSILLTAIMQVLLTVPSCSNVG